MKKEGKIKIPRVTLTCHIDFVLLDEEPWRWGKLQWYLEILFMYTLIESLFKSCFFWLVYLHIILPAPAIHTANFRRWWGMWAGSLLSTCPPYVTLMIFVVGGACQPGFFNSTLVLIWFWGLRWSIVKVLHSKTWERKGKTKQRDIHQ